jgi:hypothetical protein
MSSPLAIAGVTSVLCNLLDDGVIKHNVSGATGTKVLVTASAPDIIKVDPSTVKTQLNLFLHQVTPNPGWRNVGLPSRDSRGARLTNPPLALDLHYLLTAYGAKDFEAEILLGYGMHLLHETPVLPRAMIKSALQGAIDTKILPESFRLDVADLAEQLEQIKISPANLNSEEMSKLWTAMQAHYRPTAAYLVSVVLIEAKSPTRAALPVLTRGPRDPVTQRERGVVAQANLLPPFPTLTESVAPDGRLASGLGDKVTFSGHHLDGVDVKVLFEHPRRDASEKPLLLTPTDSSATGAVVDIATGPNAADDWPAGVWTVTALVKKPGETEPRASNPLPMLLAPTLDLASSTAKREASGTVTVSLVVKPLVRPGQRVSLALGSASALPEPFAVPTGKLGFKFGNLPKGNYPVCLLVDGVESPLVDHKQVPPKFDPKQTLPVPA